MTLLETAVLALVIGLMAMVNICAIFAGINKILDTKMRAKSVLEYKIFKREMKELGTFIETCINGYFRIKKSETKETYNKSASYSAIRPTIKEVKNEKEYDPELDDDSELDWDK